MAALAVARRAATKGVREVELILGSKIKDKVRDAWTRELKTHLHPGEQLILLARNSLMRPMCDGLAVTNARILAFFSASLTLKGTQINVMADEIQGVTIRHKMGHNYLVATRGAGEETVLASLNKPDVEVVLTACQRLVAGEASTEVRSAVDARAAAEREDDEQWSRVQVIGAAVSNAAWKVLREHSGQAESPWFVIGAGSAGVFAAFEDRCMIVKVGGLTSMVTGSLGGGRITTFPYRDVTGIEFNGGFVTGVLEVLTPSYQGTANKDYWRGAGKKRNSDSNDPWTLSNTLPLAKAVYQSALPLLNELRAKVTTAKQTMVVITQSAAPQAQSPAATSGLVDELRQLAALREQGALTEDEFVAAKQVAINRQR